MKRLTKKIRKIARQEISRDQEEGLVHTQMTWDRDKTDGAYCFWTPIDPSLTNALESNVTISKRKFISQPNWGYPGGYLNYETGATTVEILQGGNFQRISHSCRLMMGWQLYRSGATWDNTTAPMDVSDTFGPTVVRFQYIMATKDTSDERMLLYLNGLPTSSNIWDANFGHFILDIDFVKVLKTYEYQVGPSCKNVVTTMTLGGPVEKQRFTLSTDDNGEVNDFYSANRKIYLFVTVIPGGQMTWTSPDPDVTLRVLPRFKLMFRNVYDID